MPRSRTSKGTVSGWVEAGSELASEGLEDIGEDIDHKLTKQRSALKDLRARGTVLENRLRENLSPGAIIGKAESIVRSSPLWSLLPSIGTGKNTSRQYDQIDALSAKVDLLVEQVALLAAKEAKNREQKAKTVKEKQAHAVFSEACEDADALSPQGEEIALSGENAKSTNASSTSKTGKKP